MKIAITGATGFVGKKLLQRHFEVNDEIRILSRKTDLSKIFSSEILEQIAVFSGDLTKPNDEINKMLEGIDVIYHCAAELKDQNKMQEVNVEGTKNLLRMIDPKKTRWVQLSSVGVYGPQNRGSINENTVMAPNNTYEITKTESDKLVTRAATEGSLKVTILRPSNIFGNGMPNQSIYQLISMIKKRIFFFVGKKGASANYVHVDDVVEALYSCGTNSNAIGKTFIISDWITIEDFIRTIANELDIPCPKLRIPKCLLKVIAYCTFFIPRNPLTPQRVDALSSFAVYQNCLIEKELGFKHKVGVLKGIQSLASKLKNS